MNVKKTVALAAILALGLSITMDCAAGHRKSRSKAKETKVEAQLQTGTETVVIPAPTPDLEVKPRDAGEVQVLKDEVPPSEPVELPYIVVDEIMSNLQSPYVNKPIYDNYSYEERKAKGLPRAMPDLIPFRNGKIAYLTFDDGPEGNNTPAVLDILKAEGVKGTFYVVGRYCRNYPETLKRIFKEGHAIGNHSYSHDYNVLYPNVYNFLVEIRQTEQAIQELIGFRPLIVRAPGGATNFTRDYYPALKAAGLAEHDWNVCIDDAVGGHPTAADFLQKVREQTAYGINPAIVLMHCSYGKAETVKALPSIIALLRERGYSFGVVTPMTPQPW